MGTLAEAFYKYCATCFYSSSSAIYIAYGLVVIAASFMPTRARSHALIAPPHFADLGIGGPRSSPQMKLFEQIAFLFSVDAFFAIIGGLIWLIKKVANITKPRVQMRTFVRFVNFYFLIIPLPAAFMHPLKSLHPHPRQPDVVLMFAVVLLILINALGDVISFNLTLAFYNKNLKGFYRATATGARDFYRDLLLEAKTYLAVVFGALVALSVLAVVLAVSSILFGIQVNQCDFSLTAENGARVLDRIMRTHELVREMYWFPNGEAGPFGLPGIPGIFLYGLSSFIPTIAMLTLSIIWLLMLPLRLVMFMPVAQQYRIICAEIVVLLICSAVSNLFHIDLSILDFYRFLNTKWAT